MPDLVHPDLSTVPLHVFLAALANPTRLGVVRRLAAGESLTCSTALEDVPKSTASHHWQVLREGGILYQRRSGRYIEMSLRAEEIDARFPGLFAAVLSSTDDEGTETSGSRGPVQRGT